MEKNRYERKIQHKHEVKQKHAIKYYKFDINEDKQYCEFWNNEMKHSKYHEDRNNGYDYWKIYYISGRKTYAKQNTNKRIRSMYRNMLKNKDFEDIEAYTGSDYEKTYDYCYEIY